jgi:hypothetical protein
VGEILFTIAVDYLFTFLVLIFLHVGKCVLLQWRVKFPLENVAVFSSRGDLGYNHLSTSRHETYCCLGQMKQILNFRLLVLVIPITSTIYKYKPGQAGFDITTSKILT